MKAGLALTVTQYNTHQRCKNDVLAKEVPSLKISFLAISGSKKSIQISKECLSIVAYF